MRASAASAASPVIPNDRLVRRAVALRDTLGGVAPSTAWRYENTDPDWPKPVHVGPRVYYRQSDLDRYLASLKPAPRNAAESIRRSLESISAAARKAKRQTAAEAGAEVSQ